MEIKNSLYSETYQQVRMNSDVVTITNNQDSCYYLASDQANLRLTVTYGRFSVHTLLMENAHIIHKSTHYRLLEITPDQELPVSLTQSEEVRYTLWNQTLYAYALKQDEDGAYFYIEALKEGPALEIASCTFQQDHIVLSFKQTLENVCACAIHQNQTYTFTSIHDHSMQIRIDDFNCLHASEYEFIIIKDHQVLPIHTSQEVSCLIPLCNENPYRFAEISFHKQSMISFFNIDQIMQPEIYSLYYDNDILYLEGNWKKHLDVGINELTKTILLSSSDDLDKVEVQVDDQGDHFQVQIRKQQLQELQKIHPKKWNLMLELKQGNDVIAMLPITKAKQLSGSILFETVWKEESVCSLQVNTTKQKNAIYISFLSPVHINKINYIEYLYGKVRIHLRMNQDISSLYRHLQYQVWLNGTWHKVKVEKRGVKTLMLKVPCKDMNQLIEELKVNGLQMKLLWKEELYDYTIKEIDYSRVYKTFSQHIFHSRRYHNLGKKLYRIFLKMPVKKNKILFESFLGRNVSGNPKYLYEYLTQHELGKQYKMYWILNDLNEEVPGPGKKILRRSIRYYYHMATAGFWMFNTRQDSDMVKRKKTIYLQTWHGTPLKRLGWDMDDVNMATQSNIIEYKRQFYANSRRWDYLIAQNQYSADIFKRCFVFRKEMLTLGYPANDVLFTKNNSSDIHALKEKMGIPSNKKVILYAPTWRDDNFVRKGYYQMKMELDLNLMREQLGDDYVVLLRMHYLIMNVIDIQAYEGFAYDFSAGCDIQELYLVSDVLITDYSSVMFDYANLKRPIIFYAYDIDAYRDSLRGFYFDFEKEACGPICKTTSEVVKAIQEVNTWSKEYEEKAQAFYDKFNHIDDGNASERILKIVLDRNRQVDQNDN